MYKISTQRHQKAAWCLTIVLGWLSVTDWLESPWADHMWLHKLVLTSQPVSEYQRSLKLIWAILGGVTINTSSDRLFFLHHPSFCYVCSKKLNVLFSKFAKFMKTDNKQENIHSIQCSVIHDIGHKKWGVTGLVLGLLHACNLRKGTSS